MRTRHHGFTRTELILVLFILVGVVAVLARYACPAVREQARRIDDRARLASTGLALLMYSGENGGFFPIANGPGSRNFEPLNTGNLQADGGVYTCPSATVVWSLARCSAYRYRGSGLKDVNDFATYVTIAYDVSGNHPGNAWMNALFLDGHTAGARPDGTRKFVIPAAIPGSPDIVITGWNRND